MSCCCLRSSRLEFCRSSIWPRRSRTSAWSVSTCCAICSRLWLDTTRSTLDTLPSRSLSLICTGSWSGGTEAQPPARTVTSAKRTIGRMADSFGAGVSPVILLRRLRRLRGLWHLHSRREIDDVDATVLRPGILVVRRIDRMLRAVAGHGDLTRGGALQQQSLADRLRAAHAEADVVFRRAALVGIAFEPDAGVRVIGEILRMRRDDVSAVALDHRAIEVEVDRALGEHALLGARDRVLVAERTAVGIGDF